MSLETKEGTRFEVFIAAYTRRARKGRGVCSSKQHTVSL